MSLSNPTIEEKPILFSTDMVKAILAGRKTETRRTTELKEINKNPDEWTFDGIYTGLDGKSITYANFFTKNGEDLFIKSPYGNPGDLLWVRETWANVQDFDGETFTAYKATFQYDCKGWKPSIHMPKKAARIWLKVTEVSIERLNDISRSSAIVEGIEELASANKISCYKSYMKEDGEWFYHPVTSFKSLWKSINGPDSWEQNPFVWVVKFEVLSTTGKPE